MSGPCRAATCGGRLSLCRLAAGALLWARLVSSHGELKGGVVQGSYNILAETAYAVGLSNVDDGIKVDSPCQALSPIFITGSETLDDAYINDFVCMQSASDLWFELDCTGVCLYSYAGDLDDPHRADKWTVYSGWLPLDIPADGSQFQLLNLKACDKNESAPDKDPCKKGTETYARASFVKSPSDQPGLSVIKVTYNDPRTRKSGSAILRPTFGPSFSKATLNYNLTLRQDMDFTIELVCHDGYDVGIEWIDWQGQLGDTWVQANGEFSSCRRQGDPVCKDRQDITCTPIDGNAVGNVNNFSFKGFSTPREGGIITVCGYGQDVYRSRTNYTIDITVVNTYSRLLGDIQWDYPGSGCSGKSGPGCAKLYPLHEADRTHFKSSNLTFNGSISEWEILLPDVDNPTDRWAVDRHDVEGFLLTFIAEENQANRSAIIKVCPADEPDCENGNSSNEGKLVFEYHMPDNEKRHLDAEAPEWEKTLIIDVTAPDDLDHHQRYRLRIRQDVSHFAELSNIRFPGVCDTALGSVIEFKPDVQDYKCVWSWNDHPDDVKAVMWPSFEEDDNSSRRCKNCSIWIVNPLRLKGEDTLDMDFMDIKFLQDDYWWHKNWQSGNQWDHEFLLGEKHTIPIWVFAADHVTYKEYRIYFEFDCPYALSATFSRKISVFVAGLALVMAIGSAGNVMALSKQIQFMVLSTLVDDSPDTYKQFAKAKTLRIFTGDFDTIFELPPFSFVQLPEKDWIEQQFEHNFVKVGDSMLTGEVVTEITKFCAVREHYGENATTGQDSKEAQTATGAMICFDHISWDGLTGDFDDFQKLADEENHNFTGLDKLYWDALSGSFCTDTEGEDPMDCVDDKIRECELYERMREEEEGDFGRRLGIMLEEPVRRSSGGSRNAGAPGYAHGNITGRRLTGDILDEFEDDDDDDSVFLWDKDDIDDYRHYGMELCNKVGGCRKNLSATTFPNFFKMCRAEQIEKTMFFVHQYQRFNNLFESLTGRAGTFLSITLVIIVGGLLYYLWYLSFLKGVQYRLQFLEPGNLIAFMLNVLYIPYTMKTGKLAFTGMTAGDSEDSIDFLVLELEPERFYIMWIACWVALIAFPIAFVTLFTWYIHYNTHITRRLMWHGDFGQNCWCDPKCVAAKLPRIPWLKKKIPILPGLMNRYVRMCIPILTRNGEPLEASKLHELDSHKPEPEKEVSSESEPEDGDEDPGTPGESPGIGKGNVGAVEARLEHSMQKAREAEEQRAAKERRWESQKSRLLELVSSLEGKHEKVFEGDFSTYAPWMPWVDSQDEDGNNSRQPDPYVRNMGLYNLVMSWEMRKGHPDGFKLDTEETFAMQQFLDGLVRLEKRLLAYNILKIVPHDGCLKPSEPKKNDTRTSTISGEEEDSGTPFWLSTEADYFDDDKNDPQGRHNDLEEFRESGTNHISNSLGERLVYDEPARYSAQPLSLRYGKLTWMKEPEQGWKRWEEEHDPTKPTSRVRYADKWQWLAFEHWTAPWNVDDISELEWDCKCCGRVLHTFNPSDAVGKKFFMKVRKLYLGQYRHMVQHHITLAEKVEMRKWIYCKLMHCMDMKMKAIYFAGQHPDFAKAEQLTLEHMAKQDFHDSLLAIYTAKPTNNSNRYLKSDSLINYTIMKIEDTYEEEEEPWWEACDPVMDGEMKVQFDHPVFWQRGDALMKPRELLQHRATNDMVPANGYWSSEYIDKVLDASVGMKRYMLTKPDGSNTQVSIEVELEHVPSLMCYTHGFKVSMPFESLELPCRQSCEILISEMGPGEQYNFGVEGLTLIVSVLVLSCQKVIDSKQWPGTENVADDGEDFKYGFKRTLDTGETVAWFAMGSLVCAVAFLAAKATAFTFGMNRAMYGERNEYDEDEDDAKTLVSVKSTVDIHAKATNKPNEVAEVEEDPEEETKAAEDDHFFNLASEAIQRPEMLTLFLQTLMLLVIVLAIFQKRREYLGLGCIIIATTSMICVGVFATLPALRQILEEQAQNLEKMWDIIKRASFSVGRFCRRCCASRKGKSARRFGESGATAKFITLTVSELGLTFNGNVDVDEEASLEDQAKSQIRKKLIYKIVHDDDFEGDDDGGPEHLRTGIKDHARFREIHDSISIAFSADQMMMSQPIPPIVACVQCINHSGSAGDMCNPKFDNYLTLFKPHGWQAEFDNDQDKLDDMHKDFGDQIDTWFRDTLGATESQRTYTKEIKDQLMTAIVDDSKGGARHLLKVSLRYIRLPKSNVSFHANPDKQLLYVTILTEAETIVPTEPDDFPLDRMSGYFRVIEGDEGYECYTPIKEDDSCDNRYDMESSEIMVALTGETTKFRLCVWVQTGGTDELVGVSPPVDLKHRLEKEEGALLQRDVCCCWDPGADDELREIRGSEPGLIKFKVLRPSEDQNMRDREARICLKTLTSGSGDSELTTEKIARYADRWPTISQNIGVRLARRHLPVLRDRLEKMQQLRDEMNWNINDDESVKRRMDRFLKEGIRRAMGKSREEIDAAIKTLQEGINDEEARMDAEEKRLLTMPAWAEDGETSRLVSGEELSLPTEVYRIGAREIAGFFNLDASLRSTRRSSVAGEKNTAGGSLPNAYETELASRIRHMLQQEEDVGAQMIHYVLMSDHIKPNKNWRPDALVPHVAKLVSNEIDDIPAVALTGLPMGRMRFERVEDESGKPILKNGRLMFSCDTNIFDSLESTTSLTDKEKELEQELEAARKRTKENNQVFLYWSGRGTWVISEKQGEPHPNMIRKPPDRRFFWVRDQSATPDLVEVPWSKATLKNGTYDWEVDRDIRINKSLGAQGKGTDKAKGRQGANFQELVGEISKLFTGQGKKKVEPDLKDCLISMNTNYLVISWKDYRSEQLIPFRKYLLETLGSYNKAWELFTSPKTVYKNTCVANLANMFAETHAAIIKSQGAKQPDEEQKRPRAKTAQTPPKKHKHTQRIRDKFHRHQDKVHKDDRDDDEILKEFMRIYNTGAKIRKLADDVVHALDVGGALGGSLGGAEGDGALGVMEVESVWNVEEFQKTHKKNKDVLCFQSWVLAHPTYRHIENFWADLTDGEAIDLNDFMRVAKPKDWQYIRDYLVYIGSAESNPSSRHCEQVAHYLFKTLDAQDSMNVSQNELKPSTGDELEDIDRVFMKFSIPLTHIGEFRILHNQQASAHLQKRLRISVKTQFEEVEEPFSAEKADDGVEHNMGWAAFRKGLDPDWEPVPNREFVEFSMSENFFKLWDTVIGESDMRRPQEWVQNYDGEHMDHPHLHGSYMRHGRGAQRWGNGTYYEGNWDNHVYSGHGRLYGKYEDFAAGLAPPIYDGDWERGKRHGYGEMRWQQDMHDSKSGTKASAFRQRGITKIYQGQFENDLFHGEGHLALAKVPTGHVAAAAQDPHNVGTYPPFTLDPGKLLEFKGRFEANYAETYLWAKDIDPDWNIEAEENDSVDVPAPLGSMNMNAWNKHGSSQSIAGSWLGSSQVVRPTPVMFDWKNEKDPDKRRRKAEECQELMLHQITTTMKKEGSARFINFFEYMNEASQRSGPALTDLAMMTYTHRGGDALHFKNGTATFASPAPGTKYVGDWWHGHPHGEGVMTHKPITYSGHWEEGKWHGPGVLSHEDGYAYKGQWETGKRHGQGLQVNAGQMVQHYGYHAYRGTWEDDQRHGMGEMMFSMDERSDQKFLHHGVFSYGRREGKCELYFLVPHKKKGMLGNQINKLTKTSYAIEGYEYDDPMPEARASTAKKGWGSSDGHGNNNNNNNKGNEPTSPKSPRGAAKEVYYKLLYFSGWFEGDNMPKLRKSWLHLVNPIDDVYIGNWYFGQVTEDGTRQGDGCIYDSQAESDPTFMECVMSGKPYIKERLVCEACRLKDSSLLCCPHKGLDRHHLKYLVYDGQWHNNLPHGIGVQFYPEVSKGVGGVYVGDFRHGSRHGRGTWQVRDKSFTYMPLPKKKGVHNWKDDMMHGVANVEDSKYVHDNVVYADNKTMMPFTSVGPPRTKFDDVAGWRTVFKGVRVVQHTRAKTTTKQATPAVSMAPKKKAALKKRGSVGVYWDDDDTKLLRKVAQINGKLNTEQFTGEEEEFDLLREPTELLQHEEDMLVLGGTGVNEVMNGLYYKVTKSFGHSLYRMVRQEPGMLGIFSQYHQRYIYKEDIKKGRVWYIAPAPLRGFQKEPGCAAGEEMIAADASALEGGPHCVRGQWLIWSASDNLMVKPKDLDEDASPTAGDTSKVAKAIDTISVQSIVGFTIRDEGFPALDGRLFVRHSAEFYERPVYANEAGLPEETNLYLYYFKQGGSVHEGGIFHDEQNIRDTPDPSELFYAGCWVVSSKMGAGPSSFYGDRDDQDYIIAYLNDRAASPYTITAGARWWVKDEKMGIWKLRPLRLTYQVLEHQDEMMDFFDSSDEEDWD